MGWMKVPGSQGGGGMSCPKEPEGELFHCHKNKGGKDQCGFRKAL